MKKLLLILLGVLILAAVQVCEGVTLKNRTDFVVEIAAWRKGARTIRGDYTVKKGDNYFNKIQPGKELTTYFLVGDGEQEGAFVVQAYQNGSSTQKVLFAEHTGTYSIFKQDGNLVIAQLADDEKGGMPQHDPEPEERAESVESFSHEYPPSDPDEF